MVGISAEEGASGEQANFGLVLALQTLARGYVTALFGEGGMERGGKGMGKPRGMIITTLSMGTLLLLLRDIFWGQLNGREEVRKTELLNGFLERIEIARVFDIPGLWEVLGDLDPLGHEDEDVEVEVLGDQDPPRATAAEVDVEVMPAASPRSERHTYDAGVQRPRDGDIDEVMPIDSSTPAEGDDSVELQRSSAEEEGNEGIPRNSLRSEGYGEDVELQRPSGKDEEEVILADSQRSKRNGDDEELQSSREDIDAGEGIARPHEPPSSSPLSDPPSSLPDVLPWETTDTPETPPRKTPPGRRDEIQDSEDEGNDSSPAMSLRGGGASDLSFGHTPEDFLMGGSSPPLYDTKEPEGLSQQAGTPVEPSKTARATQNRASATSGKGSPKRPDVIIITHMSTLLSSLFQQREKSIAHETIQLLSSHIRYLARAPEHGGPLIMLLNSTTSSSSSPGNVTNSTGTAAPERQDRPTPPPPPPENPSTSTAPRNKPLDPTLRSIFNPPPLPVSGLNYTYDTPHSRKSKPSFGLIFTQMLDMHLLCTRVPKMRDDAEALYAPAEVAFGAPTPKVAFGWVVEMLLDEMGIWKGRTAVEGGQRRKSREQRWGAVEISRNQRGRGIAMADLFGRRDMSGETIIAAGFGGRRV